MNLRDTIINEHKAHLEHLRARLANTPNTIEGAARAWKLRHQMAKTQAALDYYTSLRELSPEA